MVYTRTYFHINSQASQNPETILEDRMEIGEMDDGPKSEFTSSTITKPRGRAYVKSVSKPVPKVCDDLSLRTFKVVIIGEMNVGKTCLTCRLCGGKFPNKTEATIGVDFMEKIVSVEGESVKFQIWDTAGQERFRHSMVPHYYRNVNAVVFMYDITQKSTFINLQRWMDEFSTNVYGSKRVPQVIIGNKCDLHADRQVRTSEAKTFATHHGLPLWETSAKSDLEKDTIEAIFQSLAESLVHNSPLLEFPPHYSGTINLQRKRGLSVNQSLSRSDSSFSVSQPSRFQRHRSLRRTKSDGDPWEPPKERVSQLHSNLMENPGGNIANLCSKPPSFCGDSGLEYMLNVAGPLQQENAR